MSLNQQKLKKNLDEIKKQLGKCALLAVSKRQPFDYIEWAYQLGQRDFGENRVQDLKVRAKKAQDLGLDEIRWHMIGPLQNNKINNLLALHNLWAIHSINDQEQFYEVAKKAQALKKNLKLFMQINATKEEQKSGLESEGELLSFCRWWQEFQNNFSLIEFIGLMGMGPTPLADQSEEDFNKASELCFKKIKKLKDEGQKLFPSWPWQLSMGMSQDYALALKYGSSLVRIGSSLFSA